MRTSTEIFKDLRSAMAELEHALKAEGKGTDEELSPLLKQALASPTEPDPETRRQLKEAVKRELAPLHASAQDDIDDRPRQERRGRLKDYTPAYDPGFDEAVFMGTGDRRVD